MRATSCYRGRPACKARRVSVAIPHGASASSRLPAPRACSPRSSERGSFSAVCSGCDTRRACVTSSMSAPAPFDTPTRSPRPRRLAQPRAAARPAPHRTETSARSRRSCIRGDSLDRRACRSGGRRSRAPSPRASRPSRLGRSPPSTRSPPRPRPRSAPDRVCSDRAHVRAGSTRTASRKRSGTSSAPRSHAWMPMREVRSHGTFVGYQ